MPARSTGVVLVRLFAIYLAITAIQTLSYVLPALFDFSAQGGVLELLGSISIWLLLTNQLLPAICAVWLWRNADRVVPDGSPTSNVSLNAEEIMVIGISLLGLYLLISGIISLARVELALTGQETLDARARFSQRIQYMAEVAISIPLLLGRNRLSKLLMKAKYAGTGASSADANLQQ
jgi:hypothetical protein